MLWYVFFAIALIFTTQAAGKHFPDLAPFMCYSVTSNGKKLQPADFTAATQKGFVEIPPQKCYSAICTTTDNKVQWDIRTCFSLTEAAECDNLRTMCSNAGKIKHFKCVGCDGQLCNGPWPQ